MIRNYIKIAWRNIIKHKSYSFINIFGLTIGMASCILIGVYVQDELSYDKFHNDHELIYRITTSVQSQSSPTEHVSLTSRPVIEKIEEFPEVSHTTALVKWNPVLKRGADLFYDDLYFFARDDFFKIFTYKFLSGNPEEALRGTNKIVLTEDMQKKYFGNEDALGQELILNDTSVFYVSAVIQNAPQQSHFDFDFLVSYETLLKSSPIQPFEWLNLGTYAYAKVKEDTQINSLKEKVRPIISENFGEQLKGVGYQADVNLELMSDIYLYSKNTHPVGVLSDIKYVYIFSAVAIFILVLASINFMNLSTSKSMERAREVGMRKVLGSTKRRLVWQFLIESWIICLICLLLSLAIVYFALPLLRDLSGKSIHFSDLITFNNLAVLVSLFIVVGFLAGIYPAFVLSSFRPTTVLKGSFQRNRRGICVRKSLIVVQFVVSIGMLIGAVVANQQLEYMLNEDTGFTTENILVVRGQRLNQAQKKRFETIKEELSQIGGVYSVSASGSIPGKQTSELITSGEGLPETESKALHVLPVDYEFLDVYGLQLIEGRNFSREYPSDAGEAVLINKAAVDKLGYVSINEAMGKEISFANRKGRIIGVVSDFNYFSLKQPLTPMVFFMSPQSMSYFSVKYEEGKLNQVRKEVSNIWESFFPGYQFDYTLLKDDFEQQYVMEKKMNTILIIFTSLAIIIAGLGLYGLVSFTILLKTKEIGVRKVLGASEKSILYLLTQEFGILIIISYIIGTPLAWYLLEQWLQEFANRIHPGATSFLLVALIILVVTAFTISTLTIKAARKNPVISLRSE